MTENESAKSKDETSEPMSSFSVSSKPNPPKTISFTVPSLPKLPAGSFNKHGKRYLAAALVVLFVVIVLISSFLGAWIERNVSGSSAVTASLGSQKQIITSNGELTEKIAKIVGQSVVSVNVNINSGSNTGSASDSFGLFGFSPPQQSTQAAGTGIIISSNGIVMTNRHVVPVGTTSVSVTLSDGTQLNDVSVIGRTSSNSSLDVAFLKIKNTDGHKLIPAVLGNSSQVEVGEPVVAIGNALGQFQNTITSGIISGYGRDITASSSIGSSTEGLEDLFQTDAAINEGNSGGPLVNLNGQVIGMDTATASSGQNIGFAIPINDVMGLIKQVLKTGTFSQPYLGVRYVPLTPDVANEYNLSVNNGAFIAPSNNPSSNPSVIPGSPAAQAGLQQNDIITQVNGKNINQLNSLTSLLDNYVSGDKITLTILRGNNTIHVNVTLGSEPSS
jgi:S1-C subfamily serine protease